MYLDRETYIQMLRIIHDPRTTTLRRVVCVDALMALVTGINVMNFLGEGRDERVGHARHVA